MLRFKRLGVIALASALAASILLAPSAPALAFKQIPATNWGYIYAGTDPVTTTKAKPAAKNLEFK